MRETPNVRKKRQRERKTERLYQCVSEKKREGKGIKGTGSVGV